MRVFIVTEETGEYSQTGWEVKAAFASEEAAARYVDDMRALPGIAAEYGPGSENRYEIVEAEVWGGAPERVMRYHIHEYVGPQAGDRERPPYRTEEFYPVGFTGDLRAEIDRDGTPGWCSITVTASTEADCISEYQRLLAEFRGRADKEGEGR